MRFPLQLVPWLLLLAALILAYLARGILLPFVVGLAVAYLLDPLADRLEARGIHRGLAAALILAAFFLAGLGILAALWPLLQAQIAGLIQFLPAIFESIRTAFEGVLATLDAQLGAQAMRQAEGVLASTAKQGFQALAGMMRGLFSSGFALLGLLSLILISPVVAFYLLRDYDRLVARSDALVPAAYRPTVRGAMREIDDALSGFVRGQLSVMAAMAVLYAAGWTAVGLNYSLVLGLLAGLLAFIPFVGALFAAAIALAVGAAQWGGDLGNLALVAGVWGVIQILEGGLLTPRLMSHHINLHPVWVLFAIFAGGELAGFVGVLVAVPAAAVIVVLARRSLDHYRARLESDTPSAGAADGQGGS